MSRTKHIPDERDKKPAAGSKERVLSDVARYVANPDELMVPDGLAGQLESTKGMNVSPSKMYEDEGHKLNVVRYLAHRGATASMPKTREAIFLSLEDFFAFCGRYKVPPTIGGFAVWNGVSVQRVNQIERDRSDPRSEAISVSKDAIRNFLELCAMDSSLNPIVYFHQNKVYYGAVENQTVTLQLERNESELTPEEQRERVALLLGAGDGDVIDCE